MGFGAAPKILGNGFRRADFGGVPPGGSRGGTPSPPPGGLKKKFWWTPHLIHRWVGVFQPPPPGLLIQPGIYLYKGAISKKKKIVKTSICLNNSKNF